MTTLQSAVFPGSVLQHPERIHLDCRGDVSYWMGEFGVTESLLRLAVERVGDSPGAVRRLMRDGWGARPPAAAPWPTLTA
ncbi:uncharacterized protein DUF3606 [Pseudacidovorax intermedius]|uniref:Uncharacterized protein DUF3606 n=1 Tax=Pseudacidovorax intermedius TaxID=433924 RepID=A0A370F5E5_9BURK|nr:DUF3606 domain-containing protein [Pseudacidovorax intermedius]RDI18610.1 uncharacterized protein DUF3606 [Pseudacidovorax intermedius]